MPNRSLQAKTLKNKRMFVANALGNANRWGDPVDRTKKNKKQLAREEEINAILGIGTHPSRLPRMNLHDIARSIYKRGWADNTQWNKAMNAFNRLTPAEQQKVKNIGQRYQ